MTNKLEDTSKDNILEKIDKINRDISSLKESSESAYVNEGIINQVRIRIGELEEEKKNLERLL